MVRNDTSRSNDALSFIELLVRIIFQRSNEVQTITLLVSGLLWFKYVHYFIDTVLILEHFEDRFYKFL